MIDDMVWTYYNVVSWYVFLEEVKGSAISMNWFVEKAFTRKIYQFFEIFIAILINQAFIWLKIHAAT